MDRTGVILVCFRCGGDPFDGLLIGRDDGLFRRVGTNDVYSVDVEDMLGAPGWLPEYVGEAVPDDRSDVLAGIDHTVVAVSDGE